MLVTQCSQSLQKIRVSRENTTFPLNRLNNYRAGGVVDQLAG